MGVLRWIAGLLFAAAAVVFAVANTASVPVNWSPVHLPATLPLSILCLWVFSSGFLFGALAVWINAAPQRRDHRRQKRLLRTLENRLMSENENSGHLPALPDHKGQ